MSTIKAPTPFKLTLWSVFALFAGFSIGDWFWRKVVAGLVLLGFMVYPGIHLAHLAIRDYKRLKQPEV